MNLRFFTFLLICSGLLALSPGKSFAQADQNGPGELVNASEPFQVKLERVVNLKDAPDGFNPYMKNTKVVHQPMSPEKQALIDAKARANASKENAEDPLGYQKTTANPNPPSLGASWVGNTVSGTPNDNDIAVSADGKVISVVNTSIMAWNENGGLWLVNKGLASFAGLPGNAFVFDPKVVYDPIEDKFVVVFLKDASSASNRVYICFSQTNDPQGNWNVYSVDGKAGGSGRWTDFPQIALSTDELFITGNLFADGGGGQGSAIWQIDKFDGYAGNATIDTKLFTHSGFSFHPVQGGGTLYGPKMYFIRSLSTPPFNSKQIYVDYIDNTIANGSTFSTSTTLNSNQSYSVSPDADQKGTSINLNTNDCRITTAYMENNYIEFAMNTNSVGRSAIYKGRISGIQNLSFAAVTGNYVRIDSFYIGYPGLAYAGTGPLGFNQSILMFNFASPDHYPGTACVNLDEDDNVSAPLVLKVGTNYMDAGMGSPTRWGDYANAAERTNNIGEAYLGGSWGHSNGNGTWVSRVFYGTPTAVDDEVHHQNMELNVYPNPAVDLVSFEFDVPANGIYHVDVTDVNGRKIESFSNRALKEGSAVLKFNTAPLTNGVYFVVIRNDDGQVYSEKFVVSH